jgi:hypothetical protein
MKRFEHRDYVTTLLMLVKDTTPVSMAVFVFQQIQDQSANAVIWNMKGHIVKKVRANVALAGGNVILVFWVSSSKYKK